MIQAALLDQTCMCSAFHNLAVVHHNDFIHVFQSDQTVGDQQGCFLFHHAKQSFKHLFFGERVEVGSGFIQDQNRRIFDQHARNRQPLTFAA